MCSMSHMADVETIIQLVPNFVQSAPSDGSYGSYDSLPCTRHKWICGWVVPCEIVCEMHVAQLLQTLSSLTAEHTNSSVVGWHLVEARNNNNHPGHLKQNFQCFSIDCCRCEVLSTLHLFFVSF
jgi:hypothetical protein